MENMERNVVAVIESLEDQFNDFASLAPERNEVKSVEQAILDKNKMLKRTLTALQDNSSCVPLLNEELTHQIMKETTASEIEELNIVLSAAPVIPSNQEELNFFDDNDNDIEEESENEENVAELKRTLRECKDELEYILETLYPDYIEDIKFILRMCEKVYKKTEPDKECLINLEEMEGHLSGALQVLTASQILELVDESTYRFAIYDLI